MPAYTTSTCRNLNIRQHVLQRKGRRAGHMLIHAWMCPHMLTYASLRKQILQRLENVCAGNPNAAQYELGQLMVVRGTPAIVTETWQMIPGYQSAADLMVTLGLN